MSLWSSLHAYSLPPLYSWVALQNRVLIWNEQGIFMLRGENEVFFWRIEGTDGFTADETHWVFQRGQSILWGEIDQEPQAIIIPSEHYVTSFSSKGFVTRHKLRRYWISFEHQTPQEIPQACRSPKVHGNTVYWHIDGIFYSWDVDRGTRMVCQCTDSFSSFVVGNNDWITTITEEGAWFLHFGQSFLVSDVEEVLFHQVKDEVLIKRGNQVDVLDLHEQKFETQLLPNCEHLIGFARIPLVLGLEKNYIFSTGLYIKEPEGIGPEFTTPGIVLRNRTTILGLAGSLWSWEQNSQKQQPKWVCDIPSFTKVWVSDVGYLLIYEAQLLFLNNEGEWEGIEDIEDFDEYEDVDVLEVDGLGHFVHQSRIEKNNIEFKGIQFADATEYWGWNENGMWIEITQ